MNITNHITDAQLRDLLSGSVGNQNIDVVESHVETCTACQQRLDTLAGDSAWWEKACEFLSDDEVLETREIALREPLDWEADLNTVHGNIQEFLDAPSHPEMLGKLDQYDVERVVGRGGMGVVLKAFDVELNRPVALKLLAPHLAVNGTARKRFAREARAAAAIVHPNVLAIHGVNASNKLPYLVMPYVAGQSLQAYIDDHGPIEEKDIVRIAMQIASGLSAAHQQGLVHRDIKPANILIENDVSRVLITDFGLARTTDDVSMTQTGWLAGTPNYMSPEQASGRTIDQRSDLFSLGSVMYFMATGRVPFRSDTPMGVLHRINNDQPTDIRQVNSDVSITLSNVIEKLLEKETQHRFKSADELHAVLEQFLAHLHQPHLKTAPPKVTTRKSIQRRNRTAWITISVAALILGCVGGIVASKNAWWATGNDSSPEAGDFDSQPNVQSIASKFELIPDSQYESQFMAIDRELQQFETNADPITSNRELDYFPGELGWIERELHRLELHWQQIDRQLENRPSQDKTTDRSGSGP